MRPVLLSLLGCVLLTGLSLPAMAADGLVATRQQGMRVLQTSMERLVLLEQAPPARYQAREVAEHIFRITQVLPSLKRLFPDTQAARGGLASPAIWQLRSAFDKIFDDAEQAAENALTGARRLGKARPLVRESLAALGRSCNSCHNSFLLR